MGKQKPLTRDRLAAGQVPFDDRYLRQEFVGCSYCGGKVGRGQVDFVPPISLADGHNDEFFAYGCCRDCNTALGSFSDICLLVRATKIEESLTKRIAIIPAIIPGGEPWLEGLFHRRQTIRRFLEAGVLRSRCQCPAHRAL